MTYVPHPVFGTNGVTVPQESEIIAGLEAMFQGAFGGDINLSPATPQGQLIASIAAEIGASNDLFLKYVNQVDPAFADGRMQDAIARIYYLERIASRPTIAACTLTGAVGTVIPQGALALAADGNIYQSLSEVVIDPSGASSAQFAAINTGPIMCPSGSITTIYRVVPGWDTITNPADGVPGRYAETRAEFEDRRSASVAQNGRAILSAVQGSVLSVEGVADAYVSENPTDTPVTIGGVAIAPYSIYVAAYGGTDADVAQAIWSKKPPGCGYTGDTTATVVDSGSGYQLPYPSYDVTFQRPAALPVYIDVTIADNGTVPSDAVAQIRNAVVAAFNGEDGGPRARIGSTLYALRFVGPIVSLGTWAQVISIAIGASASPTDPDLTVNIDQMPSLDPANISVSTA